jgi:putative Mg2+ transporter-C (MgtC) family protein
MNEYDILVRTSAALVAGALIGLERTYRGRAAGLRTYALVALGSALLVAAAEYAVSWAAPGNGDPTRVVQGIVTGIGFLGAGVIIKEGFTVRGLTTAASIWVVAAIGVAFGMGLHVPASSSRPILYRPAGFSEGRVPVQSMVHCQVGFLRDQRFDEIRLGELVGQHGFSIDEVSSRLDGATQMLEYDLVRCARSNGLPSPHKGCWPSQP